MSAWDDVKVKHTSAVEALENLIPSYGYSEEHKAANTDEKLREHILQKMRKIKEDLFHIIAFIYETQSEHVDTVFPKLRDEVDLFGDEVKISYFKWRAFPPKILEILLMHDFDLVKGTDTFLDILEKLYKNILDYKRVDHKVFNISEIRTKAKNAEKQLRTLLITYKEREALFDIEETDIEKAYERIREDIAKKF